MMMMMMMPLVQKYVWFEDKIVSGTSDVFGGCNKDLSVIY